METPCTCGTLTSTTLHLKFWLQENKIGTYLQREQLRVNFVIVLLLLKSKLLKTSWLVNKIINFVFIFLLLFQFKIENNETKNWEQKKTIFFSSFKLLKTVSSWLEFTRKNRKKNCNISFGSNFKIISFLFFYTNNSLNYEVPLFKGLPTHTSYTLLGFVVTLHFRQTSLLLKSFHLKISYLVRSSHFFCAIRFKS